MAITIQDKPGALPLTAVLLAIRAADTLQEGRAALKSICRLTDGESRQVAAEYARAKGFEINTKLSADAATLHARFLEEAPALEGTRTVRCYREIPETLVQTFIRALESGIEFANKLPPDAQDGIELQASLRFAVRHRSNYNPCSGLLYDPLEGLLLKTLPAGAREEAFEGYVRLYAAPSHWRACENREVMHKGGHTSGSYRHLWGTFPRSVRRSRTRDSG